MTKNKQKFSDWLIDYYGVNVRDFNETKVPWFWRQFKHVNGLGVRGKDIYLRYLSIMSEEPKVRRLLHECKHTSRQKKVGWNWWLVKYAFDSNFRRREEVDAFTRNMAYRVLKGKDFSSMAEEYTDFIAYNYFPSKRVRRRQELRILKELKRNLDNIIEGTYTEVKDLHDLWELEQR